MKRRDLLRHLRQHGWRLVREGGEHSIWENPTTHRRTSVPRHSEILEFPVGENRRRRKSHLTKASPAGQKSHPRAHPAMGVQSWMEQGCRPRH